MTEHVVHAAFVGKHVRSAELNARHVLDSFKRVVGIHAPKHKQFAQDRTNEDALRSGHGCLVVHACSSRAALKESIA